MLQGRFEWTVGVAGVAVVATIVAWYSIAWTRHVERTSVPEQASVASPHPPPVITSAPPAVSGVMSRPAVRPPARLISATFIASRGGSWLQVRSGSHAGRVLYDGTISQGAKVRVRSTRVWARLGAGSNLDLWVNGKAVALPLFGTYDVFVTARGVRPDPTFHPDPVGQATTAQSP